MTIKSKVFKDKLELKNIKVYDKECPMFVPIIEGKNKEDINKYIDEYLNEYRNKNIDLIIPGCTHYPLISKELENYLTVPVLDIGYIIASSLDIKDSKKGIEIYFSKIDESLKENVKKIIGDIDIKLKKL
jgi:glutamate racemase